MVAADGVLDGIKDTDGVKGVTIGDLSDEDNMKTLQLNLFNQGDVNYDKANTTAVFKQWAMDKMQTVHADGWANSANNTGGPSKKNLKDLATNLDQVANAWMAGDVDAFSKIALSHGHSFVYGDPNEEHEGEKKLYLKTVEGYAPINTNATYALQRLL